jgi:hydrogenase expression/formation protein HypC
MHELAITQSVVDMVAERTAGRHVSIVRLDVGALSGVVPDAMQFCYELIVGGTALEGSTLVIEQTLQGYGGQLALVDVSGVQRKINIGMLDLDEQSDLGPGDWVLIHMGFAVERTDAAGAEQALQGLELMGRARDD